jgi:excisionase family DNA binding protein
VVSSSAPPPVTGPPPRRPAGVHVPCASPGRAVAARRRCPGHTATGPPGWRSGVRPGRTPRTSRRTGRDAAKWPRLPVTPGPVGAAATRISAFAADLTTRPGRACMHPPHGHAAATDTNRAPGQHPAPEGGTAIVAGEPDELLTLGQAAAELKVSREALYRWRRRGTGPPTVRLPGGTVRIRRSALHEWLRTLQDPSEEHTA